MLSSLQPPRHPSSSTLTLTCFLEKYEFNKTQRHDAHRAKFSLSEKTFYVLFLTTRNFQETHLPSPRNRHCFFFPVHAHFHSRETVAVFICPSFMALIFFLQQRSFILYSRLKNCDKSSRRRLQLLQFILYLWLVINPNKRDF